MNNNEIKELLEDYARQELIVTSATAELKLIEAKLAVAFGDRQDHVWSDNAHIAYQRGRKSKNWQQAAMIAGIPPEKYAAYARPPAIDWRKMCLNEGVEEEDVPYTRGPSSVKISIIKPEE